MGAHAKNPSEKSGNIFTNTANKIGRGFWWGGWAFGELAVTTAALVPGAAFVAEVANVFSRSIKGYDVAPSYIENVRADVGLRLEGSVFQQIYGLIGSACVGSARVAGAVAEFGGDIVGVAASYSGKYEPGVDTAGRVYVDSAIAAVAGAAAVKIFSTPISHPSPRHA